MALAVPLKGAHYKQVIRYVIVAIYDHTPRNNCMK